MGKTKQDCSTAPSRRESGALQSGMNASDIFKNLEVGEVGPDWRVINPFSELEAQQLLREMGDDLDPTIAAKLLELEYDGDFSQYKGWYLGRRSLIASPQKTCPGMSNAASLLADAIDNKDKIAVFCDYDLDGAAAGEVFRRGLAPYGADLYYGWANAAQGFGLTNEFVEQAAKQGAKVLVTLDCGSTQIDQIELARSLGMKTIVVDHHHFSDDNPADFHLNPKIKDPPTSMNTGAQLAWKLAAAVQIAEDGEISEEHEQEALNLAGMGCLADMESTALPENRAFFWHAHDRPVPGIRALAERLGEDPERPGAMIRTQAVLNLPKRTSLVSAADVGALLATESAEEAAPIVDRLLAEYQQAQPAKQAMMEKVVEEIGAAKWTDDKPKRPRPKTRIETVVLDGFEDYAGYSGVVANAAASKAYKPVAVFVPKGVDEHGQQLYKFSTRNAGTQSKVQIGALIEDPEMRQACKIKKVDESGEVVEVPSIGGHSDVVSGTCRQENIDQVISAMQSWAKGIDESKYWNMPKYRSEYLIERRIDPERLAKIEQQAARLGPFGSGQQLSELPKADQPEKKTYHSPLKISVVGVLDQLSDDPDNPNFKISQLTLSDGQTREVRFPAEAQAPVGKMCEWILRVDGSDSPYYLRKFHDPTE
jgi:single-stranded DNA-specific DHH superfamily exonuclease